MKKLIWKINFNMSFIIELIRFLFQRKKYWLIPIVIVLGLFGILIVLSQGSAVAPFIYTIF